MKMKHEKTTSVFPTVHLLLLLVSATQPVFTVSTTLYSNETDRTALLDFRRKIFDDPHGMFNSWNDYEHHCRWQGVSCGPRHQRVVALRLPDKGLVGTISPQIGNLTFLRYVDLSSNALYGHIPGETGRLFRLRHLNLSFNALTGELVAVNLSNCLQLREISIYRNGLQGKLPINLTYLKNLQLLYLFGNQLTGEIPPAFGNFSSLQILSMSENHFEGSIPHEITQCRTLYFLSIGANYLSGTLSSAFFNMTSIKVFVVAENSLEGTIPSYIGNTMPNLEGFGISNNKFHGTIPISFPNASNLQYLDLSENYFVGQVPNNIGSLRDLLLLNFGINLLGNNGPLDDLAFIPSLSNCSMLQKFSIYGNRFEGRLPNTIANLSSKLVALDLGFNKISGTIPIGIKHLTSLTGLGLDENLLSGIIPSEIGDLQKLQGLDLDGNHFFGKIPSTLFNLTSLSLLQISNNNLEGNIPSDVRNLWNLNELNLSYNKLNGTIPEQVFSLPSLSKTLDLSNNFFVGSLSPEVGKLKTLDFLDISRNKISGKIPESLGDCLSLTYLDMHANLLEGKIPHSLVFLKSIRHLDISNNNLTGELPREFQNLSYLQYLNLSFNDLEGEVPTMGVFATVSNVSLLGNNKLCGGVPELKLPPCPMQKRKHRKHFKFMIVIFTCVSVALVFASVVAFLTLRRRKNKRRESFMLFAESEKLSKVSYSQLHRATEGFSDTNLVGFGSFGSVYRGKLFEQGGKQTIAVKVLDLLKNGSSKSFLTECKVLRNIRHRNLVPILTCCSSCDFAGNEFRALVYEFMENGDLHTWLHTQFLDAKTKFLSVLQRLNIAIDVASALRYLHDDCEPPVIHCDIKPSNILLDKDLIAHVGDFGLSRLYSRTIEGSFGEQTSTIGLKGSIGYIPPEYGIGVKASTFGDIYSYGILFLELFTGKRPTDDLFNEGCTSICEYVEMALPREVMNVIDPLLLECLESNQGIKPDGKLEKHNNLMEIEGSKMHDFFISIFEIGLSCVSSSPMARTHMRDVTRELHKIKKLFFNLY